MEGPALTACSQRGRHAVPSSAARLAARLSQHAFHGLCKQSATAALNELFDALERSRLLIADDTAIGLADLRDATEAAINALRLLDSVRRFVAEPLVRGESLEDPEYDQGPERALQPSMTLPAVGTT